MNKISVVKRVAWLSVAMLTFVCGQQAKAQTPPSPPFTVLMYYDGSAEFAEAYTEALTGFTEDPDYLPVFETSDPAVFTGMLSINANSDCNSFSHPYDVYFAITTDGVLATSWNALAGLIGFNSNYASMYLEPSDGTISAYMVTSSSIPDVEPTPSAPPCFLPWRADITDEILGNPPAQATTGTAAGGPSESVNFLDDPNAPPTTSMVVGGSLELTEFSEAPLGNGSGGGGILPDWDEIAREFNEWLQRNLDKARAKLAALLGDMADFIDGLGPETIFDVEFSFKITPLGPEAEVTITARNVPGSKVAELTRKLRDMVKPGQ